VNLAPLVYWSGMTDIVAAAHEPLQPRASRARRDEGRRDGLLVVMAGVFVAARALEPQYPWLAT
jgi:hypothetical protein